MANRNLRKRGFSLVEVIVAAALLAVGISACLGVLGVMANTEDRADKSEKFQTLAHRKLKEIISTGEYQQAPLDGDFSAEGIDGVTWSATDDPSGVESLDIVTVTVKAPIGADTFDFVATELIYRADLQQDGTGTGAGTANVAGGDLLP